MRSAPPPPDADAQGEIRTVPVFTAIRSSKEEPDCALRHRYGYAADLPRSLPSGICHPPQEFPAHHRGRVRTASSPYSPDLSWRLIKGLSNAGSSRTPLRPASRTRTIWQCWHVPSLSGLSHPPRHHPDKAAPSSTHPAATGPAVKVSHLHSDLSASRRTHTLRHSCAMSLLQAGVDLRDRALARPRRRPVHRRLPARRHQHQGERPRPHHTHISETRPLSANQKVLAFLDSL